MKFSKRFLLLIFICFSSLVLIDRTEAQCPMCKISAESNLARGGKTGRGLNAGILYLFFLPYTLVGTIGLIWWRHHRKEEDEVEVLP